MKTEAELNEHILAITVLIKEKYPELVKFIGEMPVKIVYNNDDKDPNLRSLQDYYNSLEALLKEYSGNHKAFIQ